MTRGAAVLAKLVVPLVLGCVALAGCGAGAVSQTAQQASGVNGSSGRAGTIDVRDARFEFAGQANTDAVYRAGQTAPLVTVLVNVGDTADRLVSVSSPVAASGEIQGNPVIAAQRAVQVGNTTGSDAAALADRTINVRLTGLKEDIRPGLKYPVTFTFERGGSLTLDVPVGYPTGELAERRTPA